MSGRKYRIFHFKPAEFSEDTAGYLNPGRGWYRIYSYPVEEAVNSNEMFWSLYEGETLVLVLLDIGAYRDIPISREGLEHITEILEFFSTHNREMIIRVVYDREGKGMEREPAFFEYVQEHMMQIGPIFQKYARYIYTLQGIFVGHWGEMHGSKFLAPRQMKKLIQNLWEACGKSCFLAVRRPCQWRMIFGEGQVADIPVGLYDDGMFGSTSHMGTFGYHSRGEVGWEESWRPTEELKFESVLCRKVPQGGETTWGEEEELHPQIIVERLGQMHVSYLNCVYDSKVLDLWKAMEWTEQMSLYDYVGLHLGYRFLVREVRFREIRRPHFLVRIENTGFASYCGWAQAAVVYQNARGEEQRFWLKADIRRWESGRKVSLMISKLPRKAGTYKVYLEIREKKSGKNAVIRFANEGAQERIFLGVLKGR